MNKSLEEAKETAGKIGLTLETKGTGDFVRAQRPRPGTLIKAGDKVYLELKEANSQ